MQWAIGDIHGCFYTFKNLFERILKIDPNAQIICVGDYADRGLNSRMVLDMCIDLQSKGHIFLRGNHDDVIDWILNGEAKSYPSEWVVGIPNIEKVIQWWMVNGLNETLSSYGVDHVGDYSETAKQFQSECPDAHKQFYRNLQVYWENSTHFMMHGYYPARKELPIDGKFLKKETVHDALWSRFSMNEITHKDKAWHKIGVFGHSPVSIYGFHVPIIAPQIRLIDTGCCLGEYLCGYCIDTQDHILQIVDGRDIAG
jgi:serine/threonine protein phosphatase 1